MRSAPPTGRRRPGGPLGLEAVPHARLGEQVARTGRLGLQLAAELGDVDAQVVGLRAVGRTPNVLEELLLGDQPAPVADQDLKQLPLGRRQPDVGPGPDDALGGQVDREGGGGDDGVVRCGRRGPADRRAEPGEKLVHAERLRDVVVGAGVERGDLLMLRPPHRQDDDRRGGPAADPVNDLGAVHVGQAKVEDDRVGPLAGNGGEARAAVDRGGHLVIARGQVDPQRAQDRRLVVDDEDAGHWSAPSVARTPLTRAGSVTRTVRPPPGVSTATIVPPIASANPLATASPRPTPGDRASRRANASKIRSLSPAGTPLPWSTTSSTTRSPSSLARSMGRRSAGECRSALENRLASTRSSSPGSARTSGRSSGTTITRRSASSSPRNTTGATSSTAVARRKGSSDPACRRPVSSRVAATAATPGRFSSML